MKILGICGSPRLNGNTEILLQTALAKAQELGAETELVTLAGKSISPCDGCYYCREADKGCRIQDDMQDIYAKILGADGIILGTPVYFWTVSAQAKALIDRTFCLHGRRELRNKALGAVVAYGRNGSTGALSVFNSFATGHKMLMVGQAIAIGSRRKGKVTLDEQGMAEAEALGKIMVEYLQTRQIPG